MNQKGFAPIILLLIVAGILGISGILYFENHNGSSNPVVTPISNPNVPIATISSTQSTNTVQSSCTLDTNGPPPDPSAVGKQTLTGIDCDHNGVRDDVQRYIALTYSQSAKEQAALDQVAIALEAQITGAGNYGQQVHDATDCLGATLMNGPADVNGGRKVISVYDSLKRIVLNASDRTQAFFNADGRLSGSVTMSTPWAQKANRCTINPATFAN